MFFRQSAMVVLCVFAECFRQDPKKHAMQIFSKSIEQCYPGLVCRGIGVEEEDQYLYFQMFEEMDGEQAVLFAKRLQQTLEIRGIVLHKVRCVLIVHEKGIYYQLRLLGEEPSLETLDA